MTEGILRFMGADYTLTADGWAGGPAAATLNASFPLVSSAVGDPVCRAFSAAAAALRARGARVITAPTPAHSGAGIDGAPDE